MKGTYYGTVYSKNHGGNAEIDSNFMMFNISPAELLKSHIIAEECADSPPRQGKCRERLQLKRRGTFFK